MAVAAGLVAELPHVDLEYLDTRRFERIQPGGGKRSGEVPGEPLVAENPKLLR